MSEKLVPPRPKEMGSQRHEGAKTPFFKLRGINQNPPPIKSILHLLNLLYLREPLPPNLFNPPYL